MKNLSGSTDGSVLHDRDLKSCEAMALMVTYFSNARLANNCYSAGEILQGIPEFGRPYNT